MIKSAAVLNNNFTSSAWFLHIMAGTCRMAGLAVKALIFGLISLRMF